MATIRLRYVNGFTNRDRKNARVRYYFRRRGEKAIPLPGQPGSEEFMAAYAMALAAMPEQPEIGASRTISGTINALVVDYYRSADWQNGLSEDKRKTRRRTIERFRAKHGDKRVALLRREHAERMLAEIKKPSAKRHWIGHQPDRFPQGTLAALRESRPTPPPDASAASDPPGAGPTMRRVHFRGRARLRRFSPDDVVLEFVAPPKSYGVRVVTGDRCTTNKATDSG
jgi:hypothetical protein